ncbi:MAG: hypothetical protein QOJ99_1099 [Bryobacterales bacterium]|jgi:hypothetical protein|nr:hypothetical protein [Bryobacterales bacterium]
MEFPDIQQAIQALPAERRRDLISWMGTLDSAAPVQKPSRKVAAPATLQQAVLWTVITVAAFFLVDAAVFRSGWYNSYLELNSTTGQLEAHLFWLRHEKPAGVPEAAVIGDSRIAEGFSARTAGEAAGDKLHFWNLGVPGSSPRTWYYLLRDGDPDHRRFKAIAFGIDHYSDQDGTNNEANRLADLNYLVGRLRLTDCWDFAQSYPSPEKSRMALTGCLFKALPVRRDVQDLLSNLKERLAAAKEWRNNGHGYIDGYGGKPEDLAGLTVDFEKRTLNFPPGAKEWQRSAAYATILPAEAPQTGELTVYRKLWIGRILDLYKDSSTRIIFLELPRAPVPTPEFKAPPRFIQSVMNRPRLTVLPPETFRDLETPEKFADGLHLNHVGRPVFSSRIGQKVAETVGMN